MKSGFTTQLVSDDPYHVEWVWALQHGSKRVVESFISNAFALSRIHEKALGESCAVCTKKNCPIIRG